jgi:hypothetical protein
LIRAFTTRNPRSGWMVGNFHEKAGPCQAVFSWPCQPCGRLVE